MGRLDGKVAIVTGSASGFGAAIAEVFLREGCKVMLCDLNIEKLGDICNRAEARGFSATAQHMDVTKQADWRDAVRECVHVYGKVDIVVNNAGWTYNNKPTLEVTEDEFDRVFKVNVKSVYFSVAAVVPQMQDQGHGGSIINISSIGVVRPRPGLVWYNATKGAVSNATKGLAAEYGPDQIRVNAILPLLSGTGLFSAFVGVEYTEENVKQFLGNVPMGRLTDPKDVANMALFLASDEGSFITGTNIEVDGGRGI